MLTVDQQLYKVTLDVMFHMSSYFENVVPILARMHMLMSFIHIVSILMADSGLKEIMISTFGSVDKMVSG